MGEGEHKGVEPSRCSSRLNKKEEEEIKIKECEKEVKEERKKEELGKWKYKRLKRKAKEEEVETGSKKISKSTQGAPSKRKVSLNNRTNCIISELIPYSLHLI